MSRYEMSYNPRGRHITWRDVEAAAGLYLAMFIAGFALTCWQSSASLPAAAARLDGPFPRAPLVSLSHPGAGRIAYHRDDDRQPSARYVLGCPTGSRKET
jgi:hypothetical protein